MKRLFLALFIAAPALSAENMAFHGTLVAPPCTISNNQIIEVAFGNSLGVNKIDGNNYKQPVNYTVNCEADYTVNGLAVVVDTTSPVAFDNSAISTSKTGLGIRILLNGEPVTFGTRVAVNNPASPPQILAVPVQDQKATLTAGAFTATMTLRADYM